jgi:hypothetical protein
MKLDTPPKVAAVVALLAYVIGVLSVSIYAQHNDIPSPDLTAFKANYIYTGVEVLGLLALGGGLILACMLVADRRAKKEAAGVGLGLAVALGAFYALVLLRRFTDSKPVAAGELVAASVLCGLMVWVAWKIKGTSLEDFVLHQKDRRRLRGIIKDRELLSTLQLLLAALAALIAVAFAGWFTSLYGRNIYGLLSSQLGGGAPSQARLLFSKSGADEAEQLGIPLRPKSQVSRPVSILLNDASYYAIKVPNGPVVQIAKSNVVGLQVDTKRPSAVDVQTRNHGGPNGVGRIEAGDRFVLVYSETMDPASLIPHWSGEARPAAIKVRPTEDGSDLVHFVKSDKVALGTIKMSSGEYSQMFGERKYRVTLGQRGPKIVISLKRGARRPRPVESDTMTWKPSSKGTDLVGNSWSGDHDEITESDKGEQSPADDAEF